MTELVAVLPQSEDNVRDVLEGAAEQGFSSVIVFGFADGKIHIRSSGYRDVLKLIGALEAAKMQLWGEL